jgi:hypothetical protein
MRQLEHDNQSGVYSQIDRDYYSKVNYNDKKFGNPTFFIRDESGKFKRYPTDDYPRMDWYLVVAIEKCDKIKDNRQFINYELIGSYRLAIREGYNHQLDPNLKKEFDYPRNQNTILGVESYIALIKQRSDKEMKELENNLSE